MLKKTIARVLVVAAFLAAPNAVLAIEPPNWVAALHIAAQGAVGLRWAPAPGATGYKVLRSATPGSGYAEIASTAAPQHFDKDVQPGATYYYVLQSVGAGGASANSQERSVAIPGEKKKEVMAAPVLKDPVLTQMTEFGKTVSKIGVTWDTVPGAIAYNIYRSTVPGKDYQMLTSSSEAQNLDVNVEVGKTYYYVVTALDPAFQETPYSAEKSVEVKEPPKKEVVVRKEKVKMVLRATKPLFEVKEGEWGKLVQPSAIAVAPNGEIYVADMTQSKVFVFNAKGEFLFAFGEGELTNPSDIAISDDGGVVAIADNKAPILIYSADGKLKKTVDYEALRRSIGSEKFFVAKIEAGKGGRWFISDVGDMKVQVLDEDFKSLEQLGSAGKELDQFRGPNGTCEDPKDGMLAVADTFNFQVKLWKDGKPLAGFGSYGNSVGQFSRLTDIAVTDTGEILALDFLNATAQAFDREGKFLCVLGVATMDAQIELGTPASMVVRGKTVYLAQTLLGKFTALQMLDEIGPPKLGKK